MECARPLALWLPGCAGRQENARRRVSAKRQRPAALQDAGALPEAPRRGGAYGVRPASGALAAAQRSTFNVQPGVCPRTGLRSFRIRIRTEHFDEAAMFVQFLKGAIEARVLDVAVAVDEEEI